MKIVEAVPNFSEGRNREVIDKIVAAIDSVFGVKVLNVDPGYDANRTVVTFAGEVESVCEAAFRGTQVASQLIDMSRHSGKHPRIGATDVLPIVPISNITLEECVVYARKLAKRISEELQIPTYCYEAAAFKPSRLNLALCRSGEYEGIESKLQKKEWKPDFGGDEYSDAVKKGGVSVVGARNFLVAVNFNLATKDSALATKIAMAVREKGAPNLLEDGSKELDSNGKAIMVAGKMKSLKAIGWYIEEYGFAQVSTNITDINVAPLHKVWEIISQTALEFGTEVTGTEIIGLIPEQVINEAGEYFAQKMNILLSDSEKEALVIKTLNLEQISLFEIDNRIVERVYFGE